MEHRPLGNTGLRVPEVGFGCGNTAGAMIWGAPELRTAMVRRAMELGIDHLDTAPNYGEGASETSVGEVLRELTTRPTIATKVEFQEPHFQDLRSTVRRSIEGSLSRLGVERVDLLYLHNQISTERAVRSGPNGSQMSLHDVLGADGVLEEMELLRQEGLVGSLGMCTTGGEVAATRQAIDSGGFHCVQVRYSIVSPTEGKTPPHGYTGPDHGQCIDYAAERGLGVVVIRVLAAGALGDGGEQAGTPRMTDEYRANAERGAALQFLKRDGGQTMAQAAIRFGLTKPGVSTVLVGFSSIAQIEEAVACADGEGLAAEETERIEELYASDFGRA